MPACWVVQVEFLTSLPVFGKMPRRVVERLAPAFFPVVRAACGGVRGVWGGVGAGGRDRGLRGIVGSSRVGAASLSYLSSTPCPRPTLPRTHDTTPQRTQHTTTRFVAPPPPPTPPPPRPAQSQCSKEVLCRQGDTADCLWAIVSGRWGGRVWYVCVVHFNIKQTIADPIGMCGGLRVVWLVWLMLGHPTVGVRGVHA